MARIAVLVVDQTPLFHLSVPLEVFGQNRSEVGVPRHEVRVVAAEPGQVRSSVGVVLDTPYALADLADLGEGDLVVVPWWRHYEDEEPPAAVLEELRAAHARGVRVAGLCGGAFVLAAAGLLDGRPATTHWMFTDKLAAQHPSVRVQPEVLYVDDGDVLTSAGTAAAIDLCLHLLRGLNGAEVANTVARRMVVPPHRAGGQAQFVADPVPPPGAPADDPLTRCLEWALEHLDEPLDVDALAARALMSRRTFTRRLRDRTGTSTVQWLTTQRLLLAQRLLETTDLPVEAVARRSGFGSAVSLRTTFQRTLGTTPREYRTTFSRSTTAPLECLVLTPSG